MENYEIVIDEKDRFVFFIEQKNSANRLYEYNQKNKTNYRIMRKCYLTR